MTVEAIGSLGGLAAFLALVATAIRAAWSRALARDRRSPENLAVVVSGATDVVEVLRAELGRMAKSIGDLQDEIDRLKLLVDTLERERDRWRRRALNAGWVATDGSDMGTDAPT